MANITTNLGPVSAYLDAVAHGYKGTREEFGEYLAHVGDNAAAAAESARQAAASESSAESSATAADESATAAAGSAAAADGSATDAGNAQTAAEAAKIAAQTAQSGAETAQGAAEDAQEAAEAAQEAAEAVLESIPEDYTELTEEVADLGSAYNATANMEDEPIPFIIDSGGYIKAGSPGSVTSNETFEHTDYVDIGDFTTITYKRHGSTAASPNGGMAFYNANKEYVSGIAAYGSQEASGYVGLYETIVPSGVKYARFSTYADTTTYGNFELYGERKIVTAINELDSGLTTANSDLTYAVGGEIFRFTSGRYIDTNPSGGTITPTSTKSSQTYCCAAVTCEEGDIFTITGNTDGANTHFLLWAFVNANGVKISNSYAASGSVEDNLVITAPANAVYLVCNAKLAYPAFLSRNKTPFSAVNELSSSVMKRLNKLGSSDDLNDVKANGVYGRWTQSDRPANSPTSYDGVVLCFGAGGYYYQLVMNRDGLIWTRAYNNSAWDDWNRKADNADLNAAIARIAALEDTTEAITEGIETESLATITGEVEDSWENHGITLTKKADNEFTLTGNSSGKIAKGFNVLLDGDEVLTNSSTNVTVNISEPGIYTLAYKTSGMTFTGHLFGITEGDFKNRRYIDSGESFEVEDDPVCLFVYAATTFKTNTQTLTVKWALYKGEEYRGFPYTDSGEVPTAVDLVARNKGGEKGVDPRYQEYISWGKANALANARHIINIKWKPTAATMPMNNSAYYTQDTEYQGIPYSSVRDDDKFVGINVSLHTFMTAVNDPRSVLYTRRSTTQNANTYYGSVCSTFCDYAYRLGVYLSNDYLGTCDLFEDVPLQDLQKGDLLYRPGHVMMCVDVTKDKYGRIETITVYEEWAPNGRAKYYSSFEKFITSRAGYGARRYKYLSGVPYTPIPYVRCFDEEEQDIVYPDVQTEYGDAAVFPEGEDVNVHVLNARDFSSIVVTKGETTVMTVTTIDDFTVEDVTPGLYTITATGTEYESVSTFFVVDMTCSLNTSTHVLSFASANATPTSVYVYWLDTKEGKIRPVSKPVVLTDADRTAGSIDLSDLMDEDYCNVKITFATDYGTATWYSETHDRWEPVT